MLTRHQVGRFEIRDELGRGAIGDVVLAWDPVRGEEVALKVVRISRTDPEMLEAEKAGLALQAQLAAVAPQVAAVYEQGVDGDYFWVALEYVEGEDLSQVLSRGPLPERRAVSIAIQLLGMLEVGHDFSAEVGGRRIHGIVHGDIKPENIRLQRSPEGGGERVRLLDFGIAKHLSQTRRFTINLFGSLPYTPPERLDRGVVDLHSDLWAVGVVLYVMVAGRRPFAGDTPEEVDRRIRRGEPPLPLPATCSPGLRRIIGKSLAFEVERRYANAAELRADLEALLDGRVPVALAESAEGEGGRPGADLEATRRTAAVTAAGAATAASAASTPSASSSSTAAPMAPPPAFSEATRRTVAPAGAFSEATRRTVEAPGAASGFPETTQRTSPGPEPPQGPGPVAGAVPPPPPAFGGGTGSAGAAGAPGATAAADAASAAGAVPAPGSPAATPAAPATVPAARRGSRRTLVVMLAVLAILIGSSQMWVRGEAREIRRELLADGTPDLLSLSERYRRAARIALPGSELGAVREELHDGLVRESNRILASYHGDDPTATERGWRRAADLLRSAVEIDWRDRESRARLLYARAHLDRIASQSLRARGQRKEAAERSREALANFREAAQRDADWPDPYLGIARIYAYDLFDLDRLQEALGELAKRGYPLGRREKAMLADGFRMRGRQFQARAERARGGEEESELVEQAKADFEQAIEFYDEIPSYGDVATNRADAEGRLDAVLARRWELYGS